MKCDGCDREVIVSWAIDGTVARLCFRCIGAFLLAAERARFDARWQRIMRGYRA